MFVSSSHCRILQFPRIDILISELFSFVLLLITCCMNMYVHISMARVPQQMGIMWNFQTILLRLSIGSSQRRRCRILSNFWPINSWNEISTILFNTPNIVHTIALNSTCALIWWNSSPFNNQTWNKQVKSWQWSSIIPIYHSKHIRHRKEMMMMMMMISEESEKSVKENLNAQHTLTFHSISGVNINNTS